jgi:hypothetical protein
MSRPSRSSAGRLEALHFGVADYAASMRARTVNIGGLNPDYPGDQWHAAITRMVVACRAYGLRAIDGPFGDFSDPEGYKAGARRAAALGCEGKWAIHPSQVALANEVFSPPEAEVTRARRIIEELRKAEAEGRGAAALDGKMIDAASEKMANNVLVLADGHRRQRPEGEGRTTWTSTNTRPRKSSRLRRAGAEGRPGLQPRTGGLPRARTGRQALGRQGADPFRRPRRGRRRQALPHRGGGARLRRQRSSASTLVTKQTGRAGQGRLPRLGRGSVRHRARDLSRLRARPEVRAHHDRRLGHGGMEIEELAEEDPESLVRMTVDPAWGWPSSRPRARLRAGLKGGQVAQMVHVCAPATAPIRDLDATMVEINPLVVTGDGRLVALDAKMSFDTNALFRRPQVAELRDRARRTRARAPPGTAASPMSGSTATSAASSTARASPWRRWT